jgi:hypothetical protein
LIDLAIDFIDCEHDFVDLWLRLDRIKIYGWQHAVKNIWGFGGMPGASLAGRFSTG